MRAKTKDKTRVVIIGAGFAGLSAAKQLSRRADLDIMVLDRNNYHTFQPLLYQVAAAELETGQIADPLRGLFRRTRNVSVVMTEVVGIDWENRCLKTDGPEIEYDYLIVATGSVTHFFGTPGAEEHAFVIKSLEDAVILRNHTLSCFEQAALSDEAEKEKRETLTHIVIVGGGPNGVEYAGALIELLHTPLRRDFPELPKEMPQVTLLEAVDGLLTGFPARLTEYAKKRLERIGVTVRLNAKVTEVRGDAVLLADGTVIPTSTVVWTAGVRGCPLAEKLGLPTGRGGRVSVSPTLQVASRPEVFVVGDLSMPEDMTPPPMVAPNAIQQGRCAADNILRILRHEEPRPFVYFDKGSLAVIGRNAAVARLGKFGFTGFIAWVLWLVVHLTYLVGFHNRLMVLINWAWDYLFAERSVRLILPRPSFIAAILRQNEKK